MKKLIKMLVVSTILLTGCSSTKAEQPKEKTQEEKIIERTASILDPGKITKEKDDVYKMEMTTSDFNFLTQRQFHDFVSEQYSKGKFNSLKIYLNSGAVITVQNGNALFYNLTTKISVYTTATFYYDTTKGLYIHTKTGKAFAVTINAAEPNYFE